MSIADAPTSPAALPGDALLRWLAENPGLLPAAPAADWSTAIEARRNEDRPCLRCPSRADVAYILLMGPAGPRWADLCTGCADWLRRNSTVPH